MSQPYNRVYNFSAGPCTLPIEVLEEAREDLMNYKGHGMSVMEMSHRSSVFEGILSQSEADLRSLAQIPSNYRILFLQGGASMQFTMIPMNFLQGGSADYITTGTWGQKAEEAAFIEGKVNVLYNGKSTRFDRVPDLAALPYSSDAKYVYFTSNETVQGVQFKGDPTLPGTVVCDMSSDILSRPVDWSKYSLVYAGAQKNMGPAGVTVVIIRDDLVERVPKGMAPVLDYRVQAENGSMYNTPPCWSIYMVGLVYRHYAKEGGLPAAEVRSAKKSQILYNAIDGSGGFYRGHAQLNCRSTMNVTFMLPNEDLTNSFIKEAEGLGLDGLRGHRSVGGIRASIYNAFPEEGCQVMASFMKEFAAKNG